MFTGLIEDVGRVARFAPQGQAAALTIETKLPIDEFALGDSVAVNGACLTVTHKRDNQLTFDISPETLSSTTLGALRSGQNVNLERALQLGDRLGGHIVTGHIDCIARLADKTTTSGNLVLQFSIPQRSARHVIPKGSVTIDGISLTVNAVSADSFTVNIIPHTASQTTLAHLTIGQMVNVETDVIGKYVERLMQPFEKGDGLTMKTLAENGFL